MGVTDIGEIKGRGFTSVSIKGSDMCQYQRCRQTRECDCMDIKDIDEEKSSFIGVKDGN